MQIVPADGIDKNKVFRKIMMNLENIYKCTQI